MLKSTNVGELQVLFLHVWLGLQSDLHHAADMYVVPSHDVTEVHV